MHNHRINGFSITFIGSYEIIDSNASASPYSTSGNTLRDLAALNRQLTETFESINGNESSGTTLVTFSLNEGRENTFDESNTSYDIAGVSNNATKGELLGLGIGEDGSVLVTLSHITTTFTADLKGSQDDAEKKNRIDIEENNIRRAIDYIDGFIAENYTKICYAAPTVSSDEIGYEAVGIIKEGKFIQKH